jgi:two-component system cell cycle sensor histidine kinase/response regulator CckA
VSTILVVDDVAANRELLVTLLQYQGHRLVEAADGSQALAIVKAEHPDLVITDVLMPVMDGYELVKQLRLDAATSRIPIVFYTAHYSEREARDFALSSGVSFVLTKPVEPQDVLTIVSRALTGETEMGVPVRPLASTAEFDREHLRLLTDQLSEKTGDLRTVNLRLRALINIGLELASTRDAHQLLKNVCSSALDLFGATYVTLGILDRDNRTLKYFVSEGTDGENWINLGDSAPGILRTVIAERRTLRGNNVSGDPTTLQLPSRHPAVHAFLAAPVASPTHVYGWICLVSNEGRTFTEDDEPLIAALSGQVGRIYENGYFAQKERDRAQQYLDTAEVILLALDMKGRITLVNRYACSLFGRPAEELLGRDFIEECVPAQIRDETRRKLSTVHAGDNSVVENPIVTSAGDERLIEWRTSFLRNTAGDVVGTLSSGTDITERNEAVEAVRTAEERMRFALQSADVGIWDMDYTTGKLQWSATIEAHYGLQPGTFSGTFEAFVDRIHPDDRQSVLETVGSAMKSGQDFSVQNRAVWPDGTVRWLSGSGRIILNEHGEPTRGVGISLDVTERRTLEEQFHQSQKMEAVGRLAGGVAHDFNNLLTAILGYSQLLEETVEEDDVETRAGLEEIRKAGERAAGLTRQLLTFSRKQVLQLRVLNVNIVVEEIVAMLRRLVGEDIALTLALEPAAIRVKADAGQIEQILMNLVVNARDAMPSGGSLRIETKCVELNARDLRHTGSLLPAGRYAVIAVSDTGTGIDPETKTHLFEPFFTTKPVGEGTGLGLATVYGIVKQSGGEVTVQSELGHGATFTVLLPQVIDEIESRSHDRHPDIQGAGEIVLLVEDEQAVRQLARLLLEASGYGVLEADGASAAMKVLADEHQRVDLVLTDVIMLGASGPDLFLRIAAMRPGIKVCYMSGYTNAAIERLGVLRPGVAFLEKPFTSAGLRRKIREALDA